ncbi:WecB/TagA/CpsF family glycosyltransferase [Sphingosinicellaceae bacterium]|nr:WecB/TagA/CpsF family glycosyltransferase [Sphingosinicellaceae bacterium]
MIDATPSALPPIATALWPVQTDIPSRRPPETARFLGFSFHNADAGAVVETLASRPIDAPFAYIVTPNVDHVVRLERIRSDLWPAYRRAWITLCDSRILGRLAASAGVTLPIIPGSDLTAAVLEHVVRPDDRIAVVGGSAAMIDGIRDRYGLTNLVHYNPPMGFIHSALERAHAIGFLIDAKARFSFLAVGSPQQEILAYQVARSGVATGIGLCVGASLQFLTNEKSRAPQVVQSLALEWLYRLVVEPRRMWRRYLVDGPHIFAIFQQWRRST